MDIYNIINTIVTIFLGGGWFIYYRANKQKAQGEATQAEAEGWKGMQELYQKTIADFNGYCEDMRKERSTLKTENTEMREKYKKMDDEILVLKRQISRQGRKIEALSPFLCNVVGCLNRKRVNIGLIQSDDEGGSTIEDNINQ
jgi:peptidoglycan hydrolase CwlO-like protein